MRKLKINKKTMRKLKRNKKTMRKLKRNKKNKRTKRIINGGGVDFIKKTAMIMFTLLGVVNSTRFVMTACAGNTCRSPMAAEYAKLYVDPTTVSSFGVNVRAEGSPMAPLTEEISLGLCKNNEDCINSVKNHKSQPFNVTLVKEMLNIPENTLQIIPMDDKTYDECKIILKNSGLTEREFDKITVGAKCETGWCKSANAPDPFFFRNTPNENRAYEETSGILSEFMVNAKL